MYQNKTGLPSVTQVIGPYIDKSWFLPEHAIRGTAVHGAIKAHLSGSWVAPLPADYQPYFDSGRRWTDLMVDRVILQEERLVHPTMGYCGQMDLICTLRGDDSGCLVDFKTSQAPADWHPLQIAAYRELAMADRGIDTTRGMTILFMADGSMAKMVEHPQDCSRHLNVFIGLVNAWKYFYK